MSLPDSNNKSGGPYRKPRADVYTVLLILALIAILLGILLLYLEQKPYDFKFRGGAMAPGHSRPVAACVERPLDVPACRIAAPTLPVSTIT